MQLRLLAGKAEYNLEEAAQVLGISSRELRSLVIRHVLDETEFIHNISKMKFRPSDLLMLKVVGGLPVEMDGSCE